MTAYIVLVNIYTGPTSFETKVNSIWFDEQKAKEAATPLAYSRVVETVFSDTQE